MKNRLLSAIVLSALLYTIHPRANAQVCTWARHSSDVFDGYWPSLTTDQSGNVYTLGIYESDSAHFGTAYVLNPVSGERSISLAKYDSAGNFLWAKTFGASGQSSDRFSLTTDHFGHIYLTGSFTTLSEIFGSFTLPNPLGEGLFVVKLDESGNVIWARNTEAVSGSHGSAILAAATDPSGNVFIAGHYADSIVFGSTTLPNTSGTMGSNIFVVKYDSSGSVVWAKNSAGNGGTDVGTAIVADTGGSIYLTGGYTSSSFSMGGTIITGSGNTFNVFIAKYNNDGSLAWLHNSVADSGDAVARSIALDATGNVYVAGSFDNHTVTFGSIVLTNADTAITASADIFLVKYSPAGTLVYATRAGGTTVEEGYSIAADAAGNIYMGGWFDQPTSFGGPVLANTGIFLTQFNTSGDIIAVKTAGNPASGIATSVALDNFGHIYVAGMFSVALTLDAVTVTNTDSSQQMFVARFDNVSTGIERTNEPVHDFSLYPNPAHNVLTISSEPMVTSGQRITISNIIGHEVYIGTNPTGKTAINVSDLQPGIYFVKINGSEVRKFIKE